MADVKGQVDWGKVADVIHDKSRRSQWKVSPDAVCEAFEPLAKAAEYVVNNPHLFSRHHIKRMRAALDALPKVGG